MGLNSHLGPSGWEVSLGGTGIEGYAGPILCAHRGGAFLNPENTLLAFEAAYTAGIKYIEMDAFRLSNGGIGIMHDTTVDRTTTGTGGIDTFTPTTVRALVVDALNIGAANCRAPGYGPCNPPTFDQVLDWAKTRDVVLVVEAKSATTSLCMIAEMESRMFPRNKIIIQTASDALSVAIAQGWTCLRIPGSLNTTTIAETLALGYTHIGYDHATWTESLVDYAHSIGLRTWCFTVSRRYDFEIIADKGIQHVMSDDPVYLAWGRTGKRLTRSFMANGRFLPGMLPSDGETTQTLARGWFHANGTWGFETRAAFDGCLQGYACPIKGNDLADNFTITADISFHSVGDDTRWVGFHICEQDDRRFNDSTQSRLGYHVLFRRNGNVDIFSTPASGSATSLGSATGTVLTLNTVYPVTITVTPTQIIATCNGVTNTVTNSAVRGGYFSVGRSGAETESVITSIT